MLVVSETSHRLFVTNSQWTGNLNGLFGANQKCATAASTASLSGTWKAMLSIPTVEVKDNIQINGPVTLMDNTRVIAQDVTELWGGLLYTSPNMHEDGTWNVGYYTWTGSDFQGRAMNEHCNFWTSTTSIGAIGNPNNTHNWWMMDSQYTSCSESHSLYCIDGQSQPNMPGLVRAAPLSNSSIGVYWKNNDNASTHFQVERSLDGTNWSSYSNTADNAESFIDTSATFGQSYYYRVRAKKAGLVSNFSPPTDAVSPVDVQLVFFTSGQWDGILGGIAGADSKCQAAGSSLGGTWKAIISDSSTNAKDRITITKPIYNLRAATALGPQLVASNATDLWDGSIGVAIVYDQDGNTNTTQSIATATSATGLKAGSGYCTDWTDNSGGATKIVGQNDVDDVSGNGIHTPAATDCSVLSSLYCINGQ